MKRKVLLLITAITLILMPRNAYALSASARCSAPGQVTVGQTFNVTITGSSDASTYWNGSAVNSSSNLRSNSGTGSFVEQNATTSVSKTYSFTALSEGSASVSQTFTVSDENYNEKSFSSSSCTISIVKPAAPTNNKTQASVNNIVSNKTNKDNKKDENKNQSTDNSLKSLSIEGFKLNPEFDKDTLEYSVDLSSSTTSINVVAEKNDETASITGDGQVEVKEGNNVINVVVTAENGSTRTYKINAYVQEEAPIQVNIESQKYTVLKKLIGIDIPNGFEKSTIKIKDTEVECFYNKKINYTIVGLKDSIGNILLYIYDVKNDNYIKYSPFVSNSINILVLRAKESEVPYRYYKIKFNYNGQEVTGYALNDKSDFRLIYGIDVETGEKGFYLYDMKGNTLQKFYNEQVNIYINLISKVKIAFLVLGVFIIIQTIVIIVLLSKNVKFKQKYLEERFDKIDTPYVKEDVKYQDLEGTSTIEKVEKKKEKTFLDE